MLVVCLILLLYACLLSLCKTLDFLLVLVDPASQLLYLVLLHFNVHSLLTTQVFESLYLSFQTIGCSYLTLYHVQSLFVVLHQLVFPCQIIFGLLEFVIHYAEFLLQALLRSGDPVDLAPQVFHVAILLL